MTPVRLTFPDDAGAVAACLMAVDAYVPDRVELRFEGCYLPDNSAAPTLHLEPGIVLAAATYGLQITEVSLARSWAMRRFGKATIDREASIIVEAVPVPRPPGPTTVPDEPAALAPPRILEARKDA